MINSIATTQDLMKLTASDVMTSPVTTVHLQDSIHDVAKIFVENNISCLAVVDLGGNPLGVITKSDLARYDMERANLSLSENDKNPDRAHGASEDPVASGFHLEPEDATIESWMNPTLFDVHPSTILPAVIKKMVKNGLHHIFVVEGETRKLKGVISTFDLMMILQRLLNPADAVPA